MSSTNGKPAPGPAIDPVTGPVVSRSRASSPPSGPPSGKIWRYAVISFCVIVAAAVLYWLGSGLAAHPTANRTTQDALHGSPGAQAPQTVN